MNTAFDAVRFAQERSIFAIGQASDMSNFGKHAVLNSLVNNWTTYDIERVKAVMDGSWKSGDVWKGSGSGMLQIPAYGPAAPEVTIDTLTG